MLWQWKLMEMDSKRNCQKHIWWEKEKKRIFFFFIERTHGNAGELLWFQRIESIIIPIVYNVKTKIDKQVQPEGKGQSIIQGAAWECKNQEWHLKNLNEESFVCFFFQNISDVISCEHKIRSNSKLGKTVPFGWWWDEIRYQKKEAGVEGMELLIEIQIRRNWYY